MVDNRQVWRTKEECPFVEERGELGGAGFEQKSVGGNEFRVLVSPYWWSCHDFLLAGLLRGKEKIFLPPARYVKLSVFLLGNYMVW